MRTSLFSSALFTLCCSRRTWGAKDHHHGDHDHHYQNHLHLHMTENPVELSPKFLKNRQLPIFELQLFFFFLANYREKCKSAFHWLLYASNPCVAQIYKEQNSGKVGKSKRILSKSGRINSDFWFFNGETKLTKENCTCWLVTGQ